MWSVKEKLRIIAQQETFHSPGIGITNMKSIEITTAQNVTIEYELASLRERILAYVLDMLAIVVGYYVLVLLMKAVFGNSLLQGVSTFIIVWLSPVAGFFLYNILLEIWNGGQTLGKKAMNIKVVRLDGKDPEWGDVVLRAMLHLVDSLTSVGVIGLLLIKTTGKSQRLGDMAAHTTVIRLFGSHFMFQLENILNISSLETYTPVHPQVRMLSERDMIFIKNALARYHRYPNTAHYNAIEDLTTHLMPLLQIEQRPANRADFLKTLLRDYIVLTR